MRFLDKEQREDIGLNFIFDKLEILSPFSVDLIKEIKPYKSKEALDQEFSYIEKIVKSLEKDKNVYRSIEMRFHRLKDIRNSLKRCENKNTLDEVELYEIKYFAIIVEEVISYYEKVDLNIEEIKFKSLKNIIEKLDPDGSKISTFYIYDSYSEKLKDIRIRKKKLEERIFEEKDSLKIKKLKEKRLNIVIEEETEELKIKKELSEVINKNLNLLKDNIRSISKLDFLIGKSKLAIKYKGVKPNILSDLKIEIKSARNPKIEEILEKRGKKFTSISIELNQGSSVITGANMGGKSISLKTIVLNTLLGLLGFYSFVEEISIPILDFIYFVSDDMQSISKGLSTFGAEIIKLRQIVESAKRQKGFILMDEFARGTNPQEGSHLVRALIKYLNSKESISLITTHYDGVIEEGINHYQVVGLKNVDFEGLKYKIDLNKRHSVEIIQENMDYRLEKVDCELKVPKDALNICILLGMDEEILSYAMKYYREGENNGEK